MHSNTNIDQFQTTHDINIYDIAPCRQPSNGPFYVYRLWNVLTGKEYIGQCINIKDRFKRHKAKPLTELRIDVNEAGAFFDCVFSMDILHTCQLKHVADHLEETEIYKRGTLKPRGYNILKGTPGKDYRMSARWYNQKAYRRQKM